MFIGREKELKTLERLYASDQFEFVVMYGRRRVGKTTLLRRFIAGKKAIYCVGVESSHQQNLDNLSQALWQYGKNTGTSPSFRTFQDALSYAFAMAKTQRVILIIDEYPYMARSEPSLASTLQMLIDLYRDSSKLMLVLCGSSMSYMEDEVLAYKSPLYGRRSAQMKILPFDFFTACQWFSHFSPEDKAIAYGMLGGTPQYLRQIDDRLSIAENIENLFLNPDSPLFEEPTSLLKQEVREPALYNAIITAVAGGATKMSVIASKVGESTSTTSSYLKNLIDLGLIEKETPYGEKESRRSIYHLADHFFRFWYRFIPDNASLIAQGAGALAYARIAPYLSDYMGGIFEDICRQFLWKTLLSGQAPIPFASLGRWWGTDPRERKQTEIDIMGTADAHTALFGECKWRNEPIDASVLETLVRRSQLFPYSHAELCLFGKRGFTEGCQKEAQRLGHVTLYSYEQMLS